MDSSPTRYRSVFAPDLFAGETALVTGGGTGIGRCIAHELASLGARVIVAGRRPEPLAKVVTEITDDGGQSVAWPLNIRDEDAVAQRITELWAAHGPIRLLVNNAGGQFASPAAAIKPKGWRAVIDTNLNGTWFVSQAVYHAGMSRAGGSIVNIVADMWNGFPGMAHTGAARAAVVNLTQTLAIEWAPAGVRVNAVAPGFILSSGLANYPAPVAAMARSIFTRNPSARPGTESEVSAAVAFLLSRGAAYITGATLRVDGASSLRKDPLVPHVDHQRLTPYTGFHRPTDLPETFADLAPTRGKESG